MPCLKIKYVIYLKVVFKWNYPNIFERNPPPPPPPPLLLP